MPTGLVSVPSRYMHSPVEMVGLDDIDAAARLIAAFAMRLEPGTSFRALARAVVLLLFDIDGTLLSGATAEHADALHAAVHGFTAST